MNEYFRGTRLEDIQDVYERRRPIPRPQDVDEHNESMKRFDKFRAEWNKRAEILKKLEKRANE